MAVRPGRLPPGEYLRESSAYLTSQLITYLGNKRSLLGLISGAVGQVHDRVGRRLTTLDVFTGSGVVARSFKSRSKVVIANDLEAYARVLGECFLANSADIDRLLLRQKVIEFNTIVNAGFQVDGFIERLYAPANDADILPGERAFYTRDNARRLDAYATLIHAEDDEVKPFLLGPLLAAASVHANTSGVFKSFYKDKGSGVGRFGGTAEDALLRIMGKIELKVPVFSTYDTQKRVWQLDAKDLPRQAGPVDLAYLDPPYNQHPYGANYFMLNLLAEYREPAEVSPVSGIPKDWNRSGYNVRKQSPNLMRNLVADLDAKFLLVSFNDEGYISPGEMYEILSSVGKITEFSARHNTFRGSRNLRHRAIHVTEHLFLVEKN